MILFAYENLAYVMLLVYRMRVNFLESKLNNELFQLLNLSRKGNAVFILFKFKIIEEYFTTIIKNINSFIKTEIYFSFGITKIHNSNYIYNDFFSCRLHKKEEI